VTSLKSVNVPKRTATGTDGDLTDGIAMDAMVRIVIGVPTVVIPSAEIRIAQAVTDVPDCDFLNLPSTGMADRAIAIEAMKLLVPMIADPIEIVIVMHLARGETPIEVLSGIVIEPTAIRLQASPEIAVAATERVAPTRLPADVADPAHEQVKT
jgi:hypothetical protein